MVTLAGFAGVLEPYAELVPYSICEFAGTFVFHPTWKPEAVGAVACTFVMITALCEAGGMLGPLALTTPAQPVVNEAKLKTMGSRALPLDRHLKACGKRRNSLIIPLNWLKYEYVDGQPHSVRG